jgi:hypothetical protein
MASLSERRVVTIRSAPGRWPAILLGVPLVIIGGVAGASWWLTEPLEDRGVNGLAPSLVAAPEPNSEKPARSDQLPDWPADRLDGTKAKELLLETLVAVSARLDRVSSYTATFHKQERIGGTLLPEQTMEMKVRQRPFAIYFKFLPPSAGKEVLYAEGHHDNKMIGHTGGVAGWLVPRLAVPPNHPLAMAENRHAITEAGLSNLTRKLIAFRKMDLVDTDAVTILDRTTTRDGRPRLRSLHLHTIPSGERPFPRVELLYDPETRIPVDIRNYDWPAPNDKGEPPLAEHYAYDNLNLDATLSQLDFDPANPAYAFHR